MNNTYLMYKQYIIDVTAYSIQRVVKLSILWSVNLKTLYRACQLQLKQEYKQPDNMALALHQSVKTQMLLSTCLSSMLLSPPTRLLTILFLFLNHIT